MNIIHCDVRVEVDLRSTYFFLDFLRNSNQSHVQQVNLNDSDVTTKLDFSKPVNFFIHGWLGFIHPDGKRWFENEGMCALCMFDDKRINKDE